MEYAALRIQRGGCFQRDGRASTGRTEGMNAMGPR